MTLLLALTGWVGLPILIVTDAVVAALLLGIHLKQQ